MSAVQCRMVNVLGVAPSPRSAFFFPRFLITIVGLELWSYNMVIPLIPLVAWLAKEVE